MGSPTLPATPEAPDYAAANREAIYADVETLPIRRQLDQASRLGQLLTYTDPKTGEQKTADFRGLGDIEYAKAATDLALKSNDQLQRGQLALRQEKRWDPAAYAAANPDLKEYYDAHPEDGPNFETWLERHWKEIGQKEGRSDGQSGLTFGEENAAQTAREVRAADPLAYDTRQELTKQLLGDLQGADETIAADAGVLDAAKRMQGQSVDPRLGKLYEMADTLYDTDIKDSSTDALNFGLEQALAEYKLGGKLDDSTKREITDSVRAGQAARGNFLGDAGQVVEALELGSEAEKRKSARLGQLLDVQARSFSQNSALRGEKNAVIGAKLGTMAGLQNQEFGQEQSIMSNGLAAAQAAAAETRAARQETYGRQQQKFANASSFVLGMPVTNQFGSLGAAQQGAVGFAPITGAPTAAANPNAGAQGAQWSQNNYSTAANIWNTQANIAAQGSPWMALLGNVAGGLAGGAGAALGAKL